MLVAIIALHLFIFWALATGLAQRAIELVAPPIQTDIVQEEVKKNEPPPPPPPEFQRPPVEVPPPDVVVDLPVETAQTTAINVTTKHVEAAPPKAVNRTAPKIDAKHFPNSEDYYPAASKRLGEEGTATVHICIDPGGKPSGPPTIAQTSGKERLDTGALELAKAGARYISPATEDGKPVAGCLDFRVKFQMTR